MDKTRNRTILRQWLGAVLGAVIIAAVVPATAWGQTDTDRGVRVTKSVGEETDTKVTKVTVTTATSTEDTNNPVAGQIITAKEGRNVTVVTAGPRQKEGKMQVAKVKVTKITDIKATGITVTSAGNVGEMNGNATLQMTANFDPTYTDDKTVVWSVAPAPESSATATIDENGLLTAGTTQGDVIVTATATNGTATTDDDKTDSKTITITTIPLDETLTTINVATATYNGGNPVTPAVTVKYGTTDLVQGTDFEIVSWSNNVNAALYTAANPPTVYIEFKGAYSGTASKTFTINKANGWCTVSPNPTTGWQEGKGLNRTTFTITNHGGNLSLSFSHSIAAFNSNPPFTNPEITNGTPGTIIIEKTRADVVGQGYNLTFTSAATANYNAASITIVTQK